jgi:hypothetical protein
MKKDVLQASLGPVGKAAWIPEGDWASRIEDPSSNSEELYELEQVSNSLRPAGKLGSEGACPALIQHC